MNPMVEFCINRLTPDVEKIKDELEANPEWKFWKPLVGQL